MPPPHRARVELNTLASRAELTGIVTSFANALELSGGVVRMPPPKHGVPDDERQFPRWRLTDVVRQTQFCKAVRECSAGNAACMWSDLAEAGAAAATGKYRVYRCHMGLFDVVAAVKIAGHHVANVYLGQARPPDLAFAQVWNRYRKLLAKPGAKVHRRYNTAQLRRLFDAIVPRDEPFMDRVGSLVQVMASLISQRCTRQLILRRLAETGEMIGPRCNINAGMSAFLSCAESVLDCDTASVFLLTDDRKTLKSEVLDWGDIPQQTELRFNISDRGLIPAVFRKNKAVFRPNLTSVSRTKPKYPIYRELRRLRCFIGAPIRHLDEPLGVIEVGSDKEEAFSKDDVFLLKAIASHAGAYLGTVRDRIQLLRVFGHRNARDLSQAVVERIAPVVEGIGCSLFLRHPERDSRRLEAGDACLFASDEFPHLNIGKLKYPPGRGLTGWVLKHARPMRISRGPGARTFNFPLDEYPGAKWEGLFRSYDFLPDKDCTECPFLAVPVLDRMRRVIGVLRVSDRLTASFTDQDQRFLESCADCIGFIVDWIHPPHSASIETPRRIFVSHGRNAAVKSAVNEFLRDRLDLIPVVLAKEAPAGRTIIEQLEAVSPTCCFAIVICTGDDITKEGRRRPRQNVVHELGFLHALYGRERVVVLCQKGIELFSNIGGLIRLEFKRNEVSSSFELLRRALESAHIVSPRTDGRATETT